MEKKLFIFLLTGLLLSADLSALPRRKATNSGESAMGVFALTSPAFKKGASIPERYTCDGKNISPELQWTHIPAGTKSFVIVLHDPDALGGPWNHWVVANLPGTISSIEEQANIGALGGIVCTNSWDEKKYSGPCPPLKEHRYIFTIYAVDIPQLPITEDAHRIDVVNAMKGHMLGQAKLFGKYQRAMSRPQQ